MSQSKSNQSSTDLAVNGVQSGVRSAGSDGVKAGAGANTAPQQQTIAHTLGEMVWLLSRSPLHRNLKIVDLEWHLMPAILLNQFRLFRAGEQVVGLALWAYVTPEQAEEMGKQGRLKPEHWRHGTDVLQFIKAQQAGESLKLTEPELKDGEVELWLVDFVVPFANEENKLAQACMADLMQGPLKDQKLRMHRTDPKTGKQVVAELGDIK